MQFISLLKSNHILFFTPKVEFLALYRKEPLTLWMRRINGKPEHSETHLLVFLCGTQVMTRIASLRETFLGSLFSCLCTSVNCHLDNSNNLKTQNFTEVSHNKKLFVITNMKYSLKAQLREKCCQLKEKVP